MKNTLATYIIFDNENVNIKKSTNKLSDKSTQLFRVEQWRHYLSATGLNGHLSPHEQNNR